MLSKEYDFIIIDTAPNIQTAALKATILSDFIIIPCSTLNQAAAAMMANKPYSFLASRTTKHTKSTKDLLDQLAETGFCLKTNITNSIDMIKCQKYGQWVGHYKPNCKNHAQYNSLIKELLIKLNDIK